jgi:methionyl-tRNA synthetase
MPRKMRELRNLFGLDDSTLTLDRAQVFLELVPGTPVKFTTPLFPRLEAKLSSESSQEKSKAETPKAKEPDNLLDISEFGKVELRVAQVLQAERVEGADKLLKLQIDLGTDKRQIVAGIAQFYPPEKIVGMKIIVVANLKPTTIHGVQSNGMLLAAKAGLQLFVLTPDGDLPPGAKVS